MKGTAIYEVMQKAKRLSEAEAWLNAFTPDLKKVILERWIQQDQLFNKGIDSDGEIIGYYSPFTEKKSRGRKKAGTKFNLYDEGDFYRSMFINALRDEIVIDANSSSYRQMKLHQEWWRDEILGLTDENFQKLIEAVKIKYREYVVRVLRIN
jgi:hypothetical protein